MQTPDEFVSNVIRPLAEAMRNLDYEDQAALVEWFAGMNTQIQNDDTLYDVREGIEGVKGSEVWLFVTQLAAYKTQMDQAGVRDVIAKPCVRAFRAQ